jgi:hypothetical protein
MSCRSSWSRWMARTTEEMSSFASAESCFRDPRAECDRRFSDGVAHSLRTSKHAAVSTEPLCLCGVPAEVDLPHLPIDNAVPGASIIRFFVVHGLAGWSGAPPLESRIDRIAGKRTSHKPQRAIPASFRASRFRRRCSRSGNPAALAAEPCLAFEADRDSRDKAAVCVRFEYAGTVRDGHQWDSAGVYGIGTPNATYGSVKCPQTQECSTKAGPSHETAVGNALVRVTRITQTGGGEIGDSETAMSGLEIRGLRKVMYIQVKAGNDRFTNRGWRSEVEALVAGTLRRFADRLTSVEVFLSDENGPEHGGDDDKQCLIQARIKDFQPVAVRAHGPMFSLAVADCAEEMERTLDRRFGAGGGMPDISFNSEAN